MSENLSNRNAAPARAAGSPVRFVAEVSSNHGGDLERCLAFVDRAAELGCDAVKFQLFRIQELFAPEVLRSSEDHRKREQWELPEDYLAPLAERAHQRGLLFSCTPFHLQAVELLRPYVDFFKVASYELLWDELLAACAATGKPVVLSTGMATELEVARALDTLTIAGARDITLLHCVSTYPAPLDELNLSAIETLRMLGEGMPRIRVRVGWSDHSLEPGVIQRAIHAHGAELIEFHLDLDGEGAEYGAGHCWLPESIGEVIRQVRAGFSAEGSGRKTPARSELDERAWRADPSDGLRPLIPTRSDLRP